jgi:L-amino acid N-acyltransferase YncA
VSPAATVRDATDADLAAVQLIYARHVLEGVASFEEVPPSASELARRRDDVLVCGLPYLVAEAGGVVVGYSYAAAYRQRSAYRHTVEDSVYVAHGWERRGIGGALLGALIARCELGPWRQMLAVIGGGRDQPSVAFHAGFGFEQVGTLRAVGFKFGRWVDSVLMQRALGPGGAAPP